MNKTTEALKSIRAILAEPDDEETISKIREALAKCKPAPDGRIPKTVFTLDDISKAAEMGRQAGMIDALAEQDKQEPVAVVGFDTQSWRNLVDALTKLPDGTKLYAAPVRTKDLTDEDKLALWKKWNMTAAQIDAVIAAYKEKNK